MSWYRQRLERTYGKARQQAYSVTNTELAPLAINAWTGEIGLRAIQCWRATWLPGYDYIRDYGDWPWERLRQRFDTPERFELAVWVGGSLCGMAIGSGASFGRAHISVNYVEGSRTPNPLTGRILDTVDIAAIAYALAVNAPRVRIVAPAPGLLATYQTMGYCLPKHFGGSLPPYLEKII